MISRYKLLNNVIGWAVFAIAAVVYISTMEPTASFWDCGEYIACSYKLEVGHPPGAPTFMLLGRFFTLFASDVEHVAGMVNLMSALASAGTILFMFWSLTLLGKKLIAAMGQELTDGRMYAIFASAAIGSLAYTFSDSFWFSAVEGEVYAMSSFFTALVFWAILRWDADDSPRADRWIVFIAYMMGLSIGVHLLNLLAIPAIVFIIYFKKYKEPTRKSLLITGLVAVGLLGVVQNGIIPGIVSAAANYELFFVNSIGLPFNGGTIIYFLLLIGMITTGILYTTRGQEYYKMFIGTTIAFFGLTLIAAMVYGSFLMPFLTCAGVAALIYYLRNNRVVLNTVILSFTVLLIGYSSFFVLVIRSQANTPMDENNPENAISLLAYLNREQYGDWPLAYGPYYNAVLDAENPADDGKPVYAQDAASGEYVIIDSKKQSEYNFNRDMCTVFPRMWESQQSSHKRAYETWGNVARNNEKVTVLDPQTGEMKSIKKPTMAANLRYFTKYQLGWMYMRYFMWNFAGRQNDIQGHGNITDGYWQSGIPGVDKIDLSEAPKRLRENAANNKFFFLPLLLGLVGLWFHFSRDWKNALVVALLFLFTGLAIVFYLNQYPYQPRERDYAYAGSFFAFAFWIGLGVYAIYDLIVSKVKLPQVAAAGLAAVMGLSVPYVMGSQGWDDHNRSDRYTARDFAKNYLATCDKNAVLFTNGDNDTFPLWYAQEVEGYRTDIRVLNLSLLNTDWYIAQANRKAYDSDRVPFSLAGPRTRQGSCDQVYFDPSLFGENPKPGKPMEARVLIDMIKNASSEATRINRKVDDKDETYPDTLFVLPTNRVYIQVDKKLVKSNGTVPADTPDSLIVDRVEWTINKSYLLKSDLMVLDLLASNNWQRPIYFAVTAGSDSYLDLEEYFRLEGLAYRLTPMKVDRKGMFNEPIACNTDIMYRKVMKDFQWGGLEDVTKKIYMDENNLRFTTNQRLQMMTLAKLLNDEGKRDKAKEVLDRCLKVMPQQHIPYEPAMVYLVEEYYRAGAMTEANKVSAALFIQCEEEYKFYSALAAKEPESSDYDDEANRTRSALQMLGESARKYGQKPLLDDYTKRLTDLGLPAPRDPGMDMQRPQQMIDPAQMESLMRLMGDSPMPGAAPLPPQK